jgi:hypothetical protein
MFHARHVVGTVALASMAACGLSAAGEVPVGVLADAGDASTRASDTGTSDGRTVADARIDAHVRDVGTKDTSLPDSAGDGRRDSRPDVVDANDAQPPPTCTSPDCSNPACLTEGYSCVAPPAAGTFAAVDLTGDSPCPAGYGSDTSFLTATFDTEICGCACNPDVVPSCEMGNLTVNYGATGCTGLLPYMAAANGGACVAIPVSAHNQVTMTPGPGPGASCTASVTSSKTNPMTASISVCSATAPSTTGCAGGDVCLPPTGARSQCITVGALATCPAAFPTTLVVAASASGFVDTRTCSDACSCGPATAECINATDTVFTDTGCTAGATIIPLDNACHATTPPGGGSYQSYMYTATTTVTCPPMGTAAPVGTVTPVSPTTVCCPP